MSTTRHGPTYRRTGPVKESFGQGTYYEIEKRIANFMAAMKNPMKRVGEKRSQRKSNPDYVLPELEYVERFEQLNKQDRWSKTEFRGSNAVQGAGGARITVQDPNDRDDTVLAPINVDEENEMNKKKR